MSHDGCRARTRSPITRIVPDLRITNFDLMERQVHVKVVDEADEAVLTAQRSIVRGGDLTWRGVFERAETYTITVSLRYGASSTTRHSIVPGHSGIGIDIHPESIDSYRLRGEKRPSHDA
ncbi:hypothetical protein [Halocatena halophila]|uniref:hypothetical protein n=1 Tax=Halocatena halophila TaxID=2814576 RepID=UPI002ED3B172